MDLDAKRNSPRHWVHGARIVVDSAGVERIRLLAPNADFAEVFIRVDDYCGEFTVADLKKRLGFV